MGGAYHTIQYILCASAYITFNNGEIFQDFLKWGSMGVCDPPLIPH